MSTTFGKVRTTDRQTDRQKVTHMSPPCNLHRWAQKGGAHNFCLQKYECHGDFLVYLLLNFVGTWCSEHLQCEHHCQSGPQGLTCACRHGYLLHANKQSCIRTCAVGNGGCQHRCTDTAEGAVCSCHVKYMLHNDKKHCVATCRVDNGGCDRKCEDSPAGPQVIIGAHRTFLLVHR